MPQTKSMTQRDRFLKWMTFDPVDRVPLMEMGIWPETIARWHSEGLPPWVRELRHLEDHLGLDVSFNKNWLPIDQELYPPGESEVIEEDDETVTRRDGLGVILREQKWNKTIPQYIRFPVENENDYERFRERLDGKDPGRYPQEFDQNLHWRIVRGEIVGINIPAFFGWPRKIMGFENWCMAYYDQPDLVRRIIADRLQLAKDLFARVLATGAVDFVQIWEDMAFKTASMISPGLVREFMLPAYSDLVAYFRDHGVKLIMVDSDGRVTDLLPVWLEAGIDGCHPCEIAAGSDPNLLRQAHPRCTLLGGVDKREIAKGKEGVDRELARLQPVIDQGAFIPMIDHFVPPDISYDTYRYYVDRRREILFR